MSHLPPSDLKGNLRKKHRISYLLPVLIGLVLFGYSIRVIQHEFKTYRLHDVIQSIANISEHQIWLAIGLSALNYVLLMGNDLLAVRAMRQNLPYRQTALVSVISYGIGNTIGFASLSSSAIRYRFYSAWGFSIAQIAQIIAFCHISFWLGLFAAGGAILLVNPLEVPALLNLPFGSVHWLGWLFLTLVLTYLAWNLTLDRAVQVRNWTLPHLPFPLALAQFGITSFGWMVSATILYALLPFTPSLPYTDYLSIYYLAQLTSIFSNVPAGLGVFETVLLLLLPASMNPAAVLGALLAYRGIHYFLPLGIASCLFVGYELRQRLI